MTSLPVAGPTGATRPLLTIAIPAYNRVTFLRRCLESVLSQATDGVEVLVSDDSTSDAPGALARELLDASGIRSAYVRNTPGKGMAANWNACIGLSSGRYVLVLHDDDFLYPGAISIIKDECERSDWHVRLFDVELVDEHGRRLHRPRRRGRRRYLPPAEALSRVLSHSSFVRFPGMVVSREAYDSVGPFDESIGAVADLEMWTRLFRRFGVWEPGRRTAAYRVHGEALTAGMWQPHVVATVDDLFSRVAASELLPAEQIGRHRGAWFHRFILAGAVRELRRGNPRRAKEILGLFDLPELRTLPRPLGWSCLRTALAAGLVLPRREASGL